MTLRFAIIGLLLLAAPASVHANPPVASYIFPAGGQRGKTVSVRVGGLFLHESCGFEMLGPGIQAGKELKRAHTLWFEGPVLPLPDSQRAEDYPKDMSGQVVIAEDAPLGMRPWRLWTSQGATPALKFMVGELPEILEKEIEGDPMPVQVALPLTINGRIFPRADVDIWSFSARKGQTIFCEVHAARLGSPLDARLEVRTADGRRIAENEVSFGPDPFLRFTAPTDGEYQVHIHDTRFDGGQAFVYRLTISAEPRIDHFYPLGGQRGSKVRVQLHGQGVPAAPVEVSLPSEKAPFHSWRFEAGGKRTNPVFLELDDLTEYLEGSAASTSPVSLPAIFNGRIDKPGEVDSWSWSAKKGEVFEFDLRAGRLGSPLDGVLRICDAQSKELARAETTGPGQIDPSLTFTVPADGTYRVEVQDRFRSRGGPSYAYRLRVDRPALDYRLWLADSALTVPRNGQAKLKIQAERLGGLKEPITLTITGLPAGVTATGNTIAAGQNAVDLTFKAESDAAIDIGHVTIQGSAKVGEQPVSRMAKLKSPVGTSELASVLLAVALPTPFKIKGEYDMGFAPRGAMHKRKYKIERNGFDGPIEISLADRQARHLQGVVGSTITVPAGVTEFTYEVTFPPWMETGRTSRTCVMGVGIIKEKDGSEHRVSFSSVNQNEQLVAVVGPGQLSLEVEQPSLLIAPGKTVHLPVRIQRAQGLQGAVRLELISPAHLLGLAALPAQIPAAQDRGQLTIHLAEKHQGPFNMPLTIRATLLHQGQPVTAEARIEILPER